MMLSEYGQPGSRAAHIPGEMTTYSAVVTTGIYCRPGCRARPRAENVRTFELAAAAEAAGFRACLRCRPYRTASPVRADAPELVCRAVQLIIEGVLDTGTEAELGIRLAVSPRHLRRIFHDHLGITPDQLARSRRAHFARRLLDDTDMPVGDVAFASGFTSLRQFNRQVREVFRAAPTELRARRRRDDRLAADGGLTMRLPFQPPFDWDTTAAFFASRAVPGVESVSGGVYRRTISLDGAPGLLEIRPGGDGHLLLQAHLPYWEGLIHVAGRAARMAGTDASPDVRVPGAWGPFEAAVQAVVVQECEDLGQARAQLGWIAERFGPPVPGLTHGLARLFPSAGVLAAGDLAGLGLPPATAGTLAVLAEGVASGQIALDHGASHADLISSLTAVAGIRPATASQIARRLGHPVLSRQP
jgi:AraC family transcriptional regulator, regulatory protein of adaptative response / DNA-3-methyladenine glycosylase II